MANIWICIDRDLLKSEAFRSLNGTAILIYLDFRMKCKVQQIEGKPGKQNRWTIINNGEIEYSYSEAVKKGISRSRFMRAIDELLKKGFIDIPHSGSGGQKGDKSQYAISNRWRDWGTDKFVEKRRPRDTRKGRGFARIWKDPQKSQELRAKRQRKTIIGNEIDTPTVIENDTPMAIYAVTK